MGVVAVLWAGGDTHCSAAHRDMGRVGTGLVVVVLLSMAGGERARVKYLGGITFLLRDRCPDGATPDQISDYDRCIDSQSSLHTQCVTDKLRDQSKLTVPIYTDICSARCYTVLYSTVQYSTVLYSTVIHSTIQYTTLLSCALL